MLKYDVEISTWKRTSQPELRRIENVSLSKAWRIVERAARRGVKRFGGTVSKCAWGANGGKFPGSYTVAVIRVS